MKLSSTRKSQSSRSTRGNGNVEHNGHDIDNQGRPNGTMSPRKKKGLPDDELADNDIPSLLVQMKAQGEEIAGLKETVAQLNSKVDKQSKIIEGIKKGMRSSFLSWESFWKKTEEVELDDENPIPSTSGGRSRGRPLPWFTVKDLSTSPRKRGRGRPSTKQYLDRSKLAKISSRKSDDEGIEETVQYQEEEEPTFPAVILGSSSGINEAVADDNDEYITPDGKSESDDEVKDTSFVPYKKGQDGKILKSKTRKARSIRKNEKHRCEHCGKLYKTRGTLKTHIQSIHENTRFQCPHCPGTFAQSVQLQIHKKLHEEGGPPLEKCKVCGMELNGRKGVMIHMATVHKIYAGTPESKKVTETKDDPFKCQHCERTFAKKEILRYHLSKKHGISGMEVETVLGNCAAVEEILNETETKATMVTVTNDADVIENAADVNENAADVNENAAAVSENAADINENTAAVSENAA